MTFLPVILWAQLSAVSLWEGLGLSNMCLWVRLLACVHTYVCMLLCSPVRLCLHRCVYAALQIST